ncbi:glycerol-3-phosphate dehydrogenase [Desulfosalsimonas propionicica]|uniref:Glycerol-3-phosphate dehydrogenase n=1 Tax=Desulfosalsimonas propionicica TaxID=332175 RepID=A0A7W0HKD3_9BACT|nr:anaerobic glycerol-3-phosphate dehydrogenase subunit GlpA [Desulfosalsimonas propionicica]MBA2881073.1 glycerol-3-phosphate dehydrogenase [Desulfosalsimonas propionicica]
MQTCVLIIGAGATGTALARDLSLRGIDCILVEKGDVNAGASGANHGLLHSGARYIVSDPAAAAECHAENRILKQIAPQCIEDTGGLFVAVQGDDEKYIADFPTACQKCGIPVQPLSPDQARDMEPALSEHVIAAFWVDDAAIDPFKLSLDNLSCAQAHGARLLCRHQVTSFEIRGGRIVCTHVRDLNTDKQFFIEAQVVVNAAGAWADIIARCAGAQMQMYYSKGSLMVTQNRIAKRVINRLRMPTDGDILVPGGTVSILGTTSERVASPDFIYPEIHEIDTILDQGSAMIPKLAQTHYIRAYCGVRPLPAGSEITNPARDPDDRAVSRGYELIDHQDQPEQMANFVSITGGKLTTCRLMAEKTADLVCEKLGIQAVCRTRTEPVPDAAEAKWTKPGLAPAAWVRENRCKEPLLCECEMVPESVVKQIADTFAANQQRPDLKAISLRSRIGKGPCQGTFCSMRIMAYLYDQGYINDRYGTDDLRAFLKERWRGRQPLAWNNGLARAELMEAMHCGLFCLEL